MKVESFELTDPLGNRNIFAKFEDGVVFYKFTGQSDNKILPFLPDVVNRI